MKKRLLIVDDDASVRKSLKKVLEDTGYEVITAADGVEARAHLLEPGIDLLILDLNMPNRDGWDVLEDAGAAQPLLPIIVVTGMTDQLATFCIAGVAVLMKKPVDVPILLQKVEYLLAETAEDRVRRTGDGFGTQTVLGTSTGTWRHGRPVAIAAGSRTTT
jgi:DNA-binding response OmpR family regulator